MFFSSPERWLSAIGNNDLRRVAVLERTAVYEVMKYLAIDVSLQGRTLPDQRIILKHNSERPGGEICIWSPARTFPTYSLYCLLSVFAV